MIHGCKLAGEIFSIEDFCYCVLVKQVFSCHSGCREFCKMAKKIYIYTCEEVKRMKPTRSKISLSGDEEVCDYQDVDMRRDHE